MAEPEEEAFELDEDELQAMEALESNMDKIILNAAVSNLVVAGGALDSSELNQAETDLDKEMDELQDELTIEDLELNAEVHELEEGVDDDLAALERALADM